MYTHVQIGGRDVCICGMGLEDFVPNQPNGFRFSSLWSLELQRRRNLLAKSFTSISFLLAVAESWNWMIEQVICYQNFSKVFPQNFPLREVIYMTLRGWNILHIYSAILSLSPKIHQSFPSQSSWLSPTPLCLLLPSTSIQAFQWWWQLACLGCGLCLLQTGCPVLAFKWLVCCDSWELLGLAAIWY